MSKFLQDIHAVRQLLWIAGNEHMARICDKLIESTEEYKEFMEAASDSWELEKEQHATGGEK